MCFGTDKLPREKPALSVPLVSHILLFVMTSALRPRRPRSVREWQEQRLLTRGLEHTNDPGLDGTEMGIATIVTMNAASSHLPRGTSAWMAGPN
jgi:hypothetical protein